MSCDLVEPYVQVMYRVGDTDDDSFLSVDAYQILLDKNNGNVLKTALEAARLIQAKAAKWVRERVGQEEIFANQVFDNYTKLIGEIEREIALNLGVVGKQSGIYAGGINNTVMANNDANPNNRRPAIRQGFTDSQYD